MMLKHSRIFLGLSLVTLVSCGGAREDGASYSFSAAASTKLTNSLSLFLRGTSQAVPVKPLTVLCSSVMCITPSAVTGKYYGVGLLIQSGGNGLSAYFGQDEWASITGSSPAYEFDVANPFTNVGNLSCCNGTGDLANGSSYISDVTFLMKYVDVTFTLGSSWNGTVQGSHKLRFVFADLPSTDADAPNARRGDLLYFTSGAFKWVDASGGFHALSGSRPTDAINQDDAVSSWVNPWGDVGQQEIPTIGSAITPEGGGVMVTSEAELAQANRTYSFKFPSEELIIFPDVLQADVLSVATLPQMLELVHMAGLPYGSRGVINASNTELSIAD